MRRHRDIVADVSALHSYLTSIGAARPIAVSAADLARVRHRIAICDGQMTLKGVPVIRQGGAIPARTGTAL